MKELRTFVSERLAQNHVTPQVLESLSNQDSKILTGSNSEIELYKRFRYIALNPSKFRKMK
jgi:hypothetical protein